MHFPMIEFSENFPYIHAGVGNTGSALGEDGVLDIDTTISLETTWHAMEDLVSMGLVHSIGIRCSNFKDYKRFHGVV